MSLSHNHYPFYASFAYCFRWCSSPPFTFYFPPPYFFRLSPLSSSTFLGIFALDLKHEHNGNNLCGAPIRNFHPYSCCRSARCFIVSSRANAPFTSSIRGGWRTRTGGRNPMVPHPRSAHCCRMRCIETSGRKGCTPR